MTQNPQPTELNKMFQEEEGRERKGLDWAQGASTGPRDTPVFSV